MAISSADEGDQAIAALDTEYTLATETTAGVYQLAIDLAELGLGETLYVDIKVVVRSGDSEQYAFKASYSHEQSEPIKFSIPVTILHQIKCIIKQSGGSTGNTFPWNLMVLS